MKKKIKKKILFTWKQLSLAFAIATVGIFVFFFTQGYEQVIIFENILPIRIIEVALGVSAIWFLLSDFFENWRNL